MERKKKEQISLDTTLETAMHFTNSKVKQSKSHHTQRERERGGHGIRHYMSSPLIHYNPFMNTHKKTKKKILHFSFS